MNEMKEEVLGELTPAQFIEKINAGGWFRFNPTAYSTLGCRGYFQPVKKVKFVGDVLTVDNITVNSPSVFWSQSQPNQILIKEPYIRQEQKKKVDGGGWREIPSTRVALRLVDDEFVRLAKEASARRKEQKRQQAEERERRETARKVAKAKQKEEDEKNRLVRGVQFLATLNEKYRGKRLVADQPIKLEGQTLVLQFENGETIKIDLFDSGEDWYYNSSHLIVNDISTESFKSESPNRY